MSKKPGIGGKPTTIPNGKFTYTEVTYDFRGPESSGFCETLFNKKKGTILYRTPKSWAQILCFYVIFFTFLSAFFGAYLKLWFTTLNETSPKYQLDRSLIGSNPGLGFRPLPEDADHGSLIVYDINKPEEVTSWTNLLDEFLKDYTKGRDNQKSCDFAFKDPGFENVCKVDVSNFDLCKPENAYGYNRSSPCIFLKLNRIYGWIPEYYNDIYDLPVDMPLDLKEYIGSLPEPNRNQIWVSCRGENPSDRDVLNDVEYYPSRGFPSYYFPYLNAKGYLSPLVGVRFVRPTRNQIINIECRAWAKNIEYNGLYRERKGSVHIELMIDGPFPKRKY